jgi:uncharacterized SAM-binding protein YcdF (DUF218 family)
LSQFSALILTGWAVCLLAILAWSMRNSTEEADAIVVLGAAQYSGRPSPVLRARLDHAMELWNAKRAPRIVFTGGQRVGDVVSEAASGRKFAIEHGVPAKAILLEASGRTSLASMHGAAVLVKQRMLASTTADSAPPRVLLVSDPFHMLRLDILARLHGLTPLISPTRTSPISANKGMALEYMLRESFALPADVLTLLWLHVRGHSTEVVADG